MCFPKGGTRTLPQACTIVAPPLSLHPLPAPDIWNSGKAMEAEAYFLQTRNRDTYRLLCPGAP